MNKVLPAISKVPKYIINQLINYIFRHYLHYLCIFITVDIGGERNCRKGTIYIFYYLQSRLTNYKREKWIVVIRVLLAFTY